jgi:TonB family protein
MTAAVLRPDLFSHLFATQREAPAKGDVAATVLSVAFHGAVVGALVWASTNLSTEAPPVADQPIPIVIAAPSIEAPVTTGGGSGGGGTPSPMPRYSPILPDIADIPAATPSNEPWYEPEAGSAGRTPPGSGSGSGGETMKGGFIVSTVVPALLNAEEVKRELVRSYPAMLRDAGIGGDVMMWILIDENGRVIETEVRSSSGHSALDQAARNVSSVMKFSPARNRDQMVKVWVSVPIKFRTQ